ncbi:FixH family protein [bacterium]|nr:FixH family protein [bacterium]
MTEQKSGSSWGIGIWALYGGFVLFVLGMVLFASVQSMDLVESDYYMKGQKYQQQIDRVKRSQAMEHPLEASYDRAVDQIVLRFPEASSAGTVSGTVTLFRPSDADRDVTLPVQTDSDAKQYLPTQELAHGMWRLKVDWRWNERDYYLEKVIFIE